MGEDVKYILEILNSKRDINGNRYWAFTVINASGGMIHGTTNCEENLLIALGKDSHVFNLEFPKLGFKHMTKDWPYAGCLPEDIRAFVEKELGKQIQLSR